MLRWKEALSCLFRGADGTAFVGGVVCYCPSDREIYGKH